MPKSKLISRAQFFKTVALGAAATVVVCSGAGYAASLSPKIEFPETNHKGVSPMSKKVLVAYASKAGSTAEVAEAIAETLSKKGLEVDVRQVKNVKDLGQYDAAVIGSCIRIGNWLPVAVNFVKQNRATLSQMPLAYFMVSGELRDNSPETLKTVSAYLDSVRAILEPGSAGIFGGKSDFSKLSFIDRTIVKMIGTPEGDWRNWEQIRAWAESALAGL